MNGTPVGLSRDLAAKGVMRAEVQQHDVVVWRGPDGDLHAWNNRCPHRGMRLSHGFVRGDKLACLYHGWHYGKGGGCAYIPAHPDLEPPATITAQVYNVAETDGVIWADVDELPTAPRADVAMVPLRSLAFSSTAQSALSALAAEPFGDDVPQNVAPATLMVGGLRVTVFASTLGPHTTLVHICVEATASLPRLKALSRWAEAARRTSEGQTV
ncbi:Rieske 2Fe-2S domain-containing protein [Algirhabdus cladophorae]|uniref:Rieske 2Fe-2S domain-containing protein n=1 Tax=Algirhabdus cladophorae TaxID=3377108 RepID=UPI003B8472DB